MEDGLSRGDRVGRYVIEELLGKGGMGAVHAAYDDVLRRRVALKVLSAASDDPRAVERILREARMAAALDHPNVVAMFDFGLHEGVAFAVMELVVGRSLRARLREGTATTDERVRWLVEVARALAAAHRAGLVHRDIKPENVMIRDDGHVKVLDFGIARRRGAPADSAREGASTPRILDDPTLPTMEGTLSGTPGYMAPEQVVDGTFDERSDQFAWGVLAHETLTGKLPWPASRGHEILAAIRAGQGPSIDLAALPPAIAAAIVRALFPDPSRRYASMDALLAEIDVREGERSLEIPRASPSGRSLLDAPHADAPTVQAATITASRATKPARRSWVLAAGATAIGAVLAVVVFVVVSRREPELQPENVRRLTTDPGCQEYPSFTPDQRTIVFEASVGKAFRVMALDLATQASRELTHGPGWDFAPSLSPDGKEVAYLNDQAGQAALLIAVDGASPPRRIATGGVRPTFSIDGRAIWAGDTEHVVRFDRATLAPGRHVEPPEGVSIGQVLELADHRVVARALAPPGGVLLYGPEGGAPKWLYRGALEDTLALSPSGASVLVTRTGGGVERALLRVPLDGGAAEVLTSGFAPTKGLSFGARGDAMVWSTCTGSSRFAILRPTGRGDVDVVPMGEPAEWANEDIAWIPSSAGEATSSVLVASNRRGNRDELFRARLDGSSAVRVDIGDLRASTMATSPDGARVVFSTYGRGLYVTAIDGKTAPKPITTNEEDDDVAVSRDGRTAFYTTKIDDAPHVAAVPFDGGEPREIAPAPSGVPATTPAADVLLYLAGTDETGYHAMRLDLASGARTDLGRTVPGAWRTAISPDGKLGAIASETAASMIDLATGKELARWDAGAVGIRGLTFTDRGLLVSLYTWVGNVWIADGRFGARR